MESGDTFRLRNDHQIMTLRVVDDLHAEVIDSGTTTFVIGDVVGPARSISWTDARERVNSKRSRLSPMALVLIRPVEGWPKLLGTREGSPAQRARVHDFLKCKQFLHPEPTPAA